jgi:hypothetical protein
MRAMVFITKCPPFSARPPLPQLWSPGISSTLPRANPRSARPQSQTRHNLTIAGLHPQPSSQGSFSATLRGSGGLGLTRRAISASMRSAPGGPPMLWPAGAPGKGAATIWGEGSAAATLFRASSSARRTLPPSGGVPRAFVRDKRGAVLANGRWFQVEPHLFRMPAASCFSAAHTPTFPPSSFAAPSLGPVKETPMRSSQDVSACGTSTSDVGIMYGSH